MQEYFFANYRLLIDDKLAEQKDMKYLDEFRDPMPYTHTFTVHLGDETKLDELYEKASECLVVNENELFRIHKLNDGWALIRPEGEKNPKALVMCSADYGEMTAYVIKQRIYFENVGKYYDVGISFKSCIRPFCEAGMAFRSGLPFHASMVEKDGCGIVFLGPSGMGKSTQAKLWVKYLNADFVIGDRPGLRKINGNWYGCGMPWDGKDEIKRQKKVPIKAFVVLEQAKRNEIRKMEQSEVIQVLLKQTNMPMWDQNAMGSILPMMADLSKDIPFYYLKNLADEECVRLTYDCIVGNEISI